MKDTNNLLDYNIWSATEYNHDTTGMFNNYPQNILINSSNDFSSIGESSLKITVKDIPSWVNIDLFKIANPNKSVTVKLIVHNPECELVVNLFHTTTANAFSSVTVPAGNIKEISLTGDSSAFPDGNISIRVFPRTPNGVCYIDNISLS